MTEINNNLLQELGLANQPVKSSGGKKELSQNDFLKLLVAQIQNPPDPLNAPEGTDFISQMANISSVDGMQKLQESFSELSQSLHSSQALQASSLVGRQVLVPNTHAQHTEGQSLKAQFELPSSTSNLSVSILNEQGELVRKVNLGTQAGGDINFTWDGKNESGDNAPSGKYQVVAQAFIGGEAAQLKSYLHANVDSVSLDKQQGLVLNLAGVGSVNFNLVKEISK